MTHTPGPWATLERRRGQWAVTAPTEPGASWIIAERATEDDARLMAAAPDLLAALKNVVRCIEAEGCDHVAVEGAAAAIARAEGA